MSQNKHNKGRLFKAIATGGMSEIGAKVYRTMESHSRHNKHFDELEKHESFDPKGAAMTFDHTNVHDRGIESFLGQEPVKEKMIQYVRLHGYEPSSDPKTLAGQCAFIREGLRSQYAKDRMKHFVSKTDFDKYVQSGEFDRDAEQGIEEIERKNGFAGFDDEKTQGFIPLVVGAVAALAKSKQVQGVVMKAGTAVKNLVKSKTAKTKAIAEAKAKSASHAIVASAISAGVPASTIKMIKDPAVLKAVTDVHDQSSVKSTKAETEDLKPVDTKDNSKMIMILGGVLLLGGIVYISSK